MQHKTVIKTNHVPRPLLYWWDLTPEEQRECDNCSEDDLFFRYRGAIYALGEIERATGALAKQWDGVFPETYFSGILIKLLPDTDEVIVGRYFDT